MADTGDYLCDPATVAGLATEYYGRPYTTKDAIVLEACRTATERFRSAVRHQVTEQKDLTLTFDGTGTRYLRLPLLKPRLGKVEIHGVEVTPMGVSEAGIIEFAGLLPARLGAVRVEVLSAGFRTVPPEIATAVQKAAVIEVGQMPGVQNTQMGGRQISWGATGVQGVREEWSAAVEKYRIGAGDRA